MPSGFYPINVLKKLPIFPSQVTDELVVIMGESKMVFIDREVDHTWVFRHPNCEPYTMAFRLSMGQESFRLESPARIIAEAQYAEPIDVVLTTTCNHELILRSPAVTSHKQLLKKLDAFMNFIEPENYISDVISRGRTNDYGPRVYMSVGWLFYCVHANHITIDEAVKLQHEGDCTLRYRGDDYVAMGGDSYSHFFQLSLADQEAAKLYVDE